MWLLPASSLNPVTHTLWVAALQALVARLTVEAERIDHPDVPAGAQGAWPTAATAAP